VRFATICCFLPIRYTIACWSSGPSYAFQLLRPAVLPFDSISALLFRWVGSSHCRIGSNCKNGSISLLVFGGASKEAHEAV
ncbi:hypothetical protein EDB83DRAFT_2429069, partial [Lactarius deliciosus]